MSFWRNKRVLVTGHTGFKGAWLALVLRRLGANVSGVSLPPHTSPALHSELKEYSNGLENIRCDIRDLKSLQETVTRVQPDVVFHLAAQALV